MREVSTVAASVRDGKGHRAYRRKQGVLKRRARREGLVCVHCGNPFDWSLPYNDRMAFTADHPDAIDNGGHLVRQDLAPMHRACNSSKGNLVETEIWEAT